jgi:Asp-tRNA(Asn)/Glu-tRNA(Gln) amidotransferase A subunit family amidase
VAANLGAVGIGTDCGGSIRVPSSFDNRVGVRSTPGVVPRTGSSYLVIFQETIGPMTRTVADAATVFDAIVGYDSSATRPPMPSRGLRAAIGNASTPTPSAARSSGW